MASHETCRESKKKFKKQVGQAFCDYDYIQMGKRWNIGNLPLQ